MAAAGQRLLESSIVGDYCIVTIRFLFIILYYRLAQAAYCIEECILLEPSDVPNLLRFAEVLVSFLSMFKLGH